MNNFFKIIQIYFTKFQLWRFKLKYLIETSAEYIDYDFNSEEIEALRAEITQLRKDLLQASRKVEALTGETINLDIDAIDENQFATENF